MQDTKDMQSAQADSAPIQEMTYGMGSAEDGSAFEASSSASSASSAQEENALPEGESVEEANASAVGSAEEESSATPCEEGKASEEKSGSYPVFPLDEDEEAYYERRAEEDMRELSRLFPELSPDGEGLSLGELRNPLRFAELREAGLSVEEAFLASNYRMLAERPRAISEKEARTDKTPARASIPRAIGRANSMPTALLLRSRAMFEGLSDTELASLYRRVTRE